MKAKAEALFMRRFEALVKHVRETQKTDPVIRISRKDWHWIEPHCDLEGDSIRYRGVEIIIVG